MKKELILQILNMIGAKNVKPTSAGWVGCSCIFAPWKHAKGTDKTPSFGFSVNPSGPSRCHCFTCGSAGDMFDFFEEFRQLNKADPYYDVVYKDLLALVGMEEEGGDETIGIPDYEEILNQKKSSTPISAFPEEWLASFPKMPHHPYLTEERGLSVEISSYLDARYDPTLGRVCFPIRTAAGVLAGLQGRAIDKTAVQRYKLYDYKGKYNPQVWANENRLDLSNPLIITEGWFDLAKIAMVYPNVAASLTSKIDYAKAKRLQDASFIITFYDYGTGGTHGRELVEKYWPNAFIRHIIPSEEVGDAGNMDPSDIFDILHEVELV